MLTPRSIGGVTDATHSADQPILADLGQGFLDTFVRRSPEPAVTWDLAPRRPRFLYRFLHSELAPVIALTLVFAVAAATGAVGGEVVSVAAGFLAVAPLAAARFDVLVGWRVAALVASAVGLLWYYPGPMRAFAGIGLALFSAYVAITFRREIGLWVWAVTIVVVAILWRGELATLIPVGALLALLTDTLRSRRLAGMALADQQEITGVERARRVGVEERTRVARELHDIVAHHMSMVAVRAETAPFRLPDLTHDARAEFAEISEAARQSLNEIRSVLAVLRSEEAPRGPQPGLAEIEQLVDGARGAGVEVGLTVSGAPRPVREAIELCAYRILQEALSNVSRHAPGEPVEVWVTYGDESLELMVANPTSASPGPPGHGVTGMIERAVAVGGSVDARRRADGRFVVEASLPLEP